MSQLLKQRRILLKRYGRIVQLERQMADKTRPTIDILAKLHVYIPEQISQDANIQPGDAKIDILADELAAAGWGEPSGQSDTFIIDAKRYVVKGKPVPLMDGYVNCGYTIAVKG